MTRKRPGDDLPLHRKLGYQHMLEMAEIRAKLSAEGHTGPKLHFMAVQAMELRHANEPTFAERSAAWLAKQRAAPSTQDNVSAALEALRLIRDGHNDPRVLAREVLALIEGTGL